MSSPNDTSKATSSASRSTESGPSSGDSSTRQKQPGEVSNESSGSTSFASISNGKTDGFNPATYFARYNLTPQEERQVDERCFTWCSQTSKGRVMQQPPRCKSLCFRRVYKHEIDIPVKVWDGPPPLHVNPDALKVAPRDWALPPEGQPASVVREDGTVAINKETVYWREGWYIWYGRDWAAAQEHGHVMSMGLPDLINHTNWRAYASRMAKDQEEQRKRDLKRWQMDGGLRSGLTEDEEISEEELRSRLEHEQELHEPVLQFPNAAETSLLFRFPPPIMPYVSMVQRNSLSPLSQTFSILRTSFEDGSQREFWKRAYHKAQTPDPFILARSLFNQVWERFNSKPPKDDGDWPRDGGPPSPPGPSPNSSSGSGSSGAAGTS